MISLICTILAFCFSKAPTLPTTAAIPLWVIVAAALALVAVLIAVIWRHLSVGGRRAEKVLKRREKEKAPQKKAPEEDPLKILKLRLARGEITKKEYERLKKALET